MHRTGADVRASYASYEVVEYQGDVRRFRSAHADRMDAECAFVELVARADEACGRDGAPRRIALMLDGVLLDVAHVRPERVMPERATAPA